MKTENLVLYSMANCEPQHRDFFSTVASLIRILSIEDNCDLDNEEWEIYGRIVDYLDLDEEEIREFTTQELATIRVLEKEFYSIMKKRT